MEQTLFDGKYLIIRTLGAGGTGTVYLAENVRLGTLWAIKEIRKHQDQAIHFLSEPHVLKNLRHPALPRIFDIIENEAYLYLVQDYIEGVPLDRLIQEQGVVPAETVHAWAMTLTDVYRYLHSQQPNPIIYRDMKPGNLIVDQQGSVKVIDFGIARAFKADAPTDTVCLGTRGYAAPEQYGTSQTDARSDIYSLGVTLYHALTGVGPNDPPFAPEPLPESGKWAVLNRVINKAVKLNPAERFQSAAEMHEALSRVLRDQPTGVSETNTRLVRKATAVGLGIVSVLFIMGGVKALLFTALSDTLRKTMGFLELIPGLLMALICFWLWTGRWPWQNTGQTDGDLEVDAKGKLKTPLKRTLSFFSPLSTGKTELACNTAVALGQLGKKVILLDLDHESYGMGYNFPADPGEAYENYFKYRLLLKKIAGYLDGGEPEISNEEISRLALWTGRNLLVYSGSQEVPLSDTQGDCCGMTPEVFRYLMRRFRSLADVVILDIGQRTSAALMEQVTALEDGCRYFVVSENLKDLHALAYRQRFPRDVDYEDWNLVVNQSQSPPIIKDRELTAYFSNPELPWTAYRIAKILRVPRMERLWALKWSRKTAYGQCRAFDGAIKDIIAAARIGA